MPSLPALFRRGRSTGDRLPPMTPDGASPPRLTLALFLMLSVVVAGTIGFMEVEQWDLWRSFYFTLITITTVGYGGDEGLSNSGKILTVVLLMGGVLSASYTLGMIVQTSVATQLAWHKRMLKKISRLKNHTIVCGFGRMGLSVSNRLADRGVPFVVIERDADRLARALELGYLTLQGSASEEKLLIAASIEHSAHVVVAVDNLAENILITMESRELCPQAMIIARAERDEDVRKLKRAGVDRVLCPFRSGGSDVADLITRPKVAEFLAKASMGGGGIALAEIRVENNSELVGVTLAEIGRGDADHVSFVALETNEGDVHIPPRGQSRLAPGDLLIVAGDPEQVTRMNDRSHSNGVAA